MAISLFTTAGMSFFEKMDAIQAGLDQLAVYPRSVMDTSKPSASPYPALASSPYWEMMLNEHYEGMFEQWQGGMLLQEAYPFVLSSLGFPTTMKNAARRLQPDCTVANTDWHSECEISYNGESRYYGGAGVGGGKPVGSNRITHRFTFDGSSGDWFGESDLNRYFEQLYAYATFASADLEPYKDQIAGETFKRTIRDTGGTWLCIGKEGDVQPTFAYAIPVGSDVEIVSEAWVDGHYVDDRERVMIGHTFDRHPEAAIVVRQLHYTDANGVEHTQDVLFDYVYQEDIWEMNYEFYGSYDGIPASLTLTREQVEAMRPDANTNRYPTHALIYDGSKRPGTPCDFVTLTYRGNNGTAEHDTQPAAKGELTQLMSNYFTSPADHSFGGWRFDGVLHDMEDTCVFNQDTEIDAYWYIKILSAIAGRSIIRASYNCLDEGSGKVYCAFYDADGKVVSVESKAVSSGKGSVDFRKKYGATDAKVFFVNDRLVPRAPCCELKDFWHVYNAYL